MGLKSIGYGLWVNLIQRAEPHLGGLTLVSLLSPAASPLAIRRSRPLAAALDLVLREQDIPHAVAVQVAFGSII
jgi:hypothetical protein